MSHDRRFLDGCVDHILSLNRAGIEVQSGNFSSWFANFQQRQALEEAQDQRLRKDIKRLEQSARRTALWSDRVEASKKGAADKGYAGHKAAKMMKRAKTIEARQQKAIEEKVRPAEKRRDRRGPAGSPPCCTTPTPWSCSRTWRSNTAGRRSAGPSPLRSGRGSGVALDGGNGTGKSSLLKLLCGQDIPHGRPGAPRPGWSSRMSPRTPPALRGT